MKYSRLQRDRKKQLLEATIDQIEADHYSHDLARQRCVATEDVDGADQHQKLMDELEVQRDAMVKTLAEFTEAKAK